MIPKVDQTLRAAAGLLDAGRATEAAQLASQLLLAQPRHLEARRLLGHALRALGDRAGAERELRAATAINKREPLIHVELAAVLLSLGKEAEAERALRAALALDRRFLPAVEALCGFLLPRSRADEALKVITPVTAASQNPAALSLHGQILRAFGRYDEAVGLLQRVTAGPDADPVFEHNLAALLCDAERYDEAQAATGRALSRGMRGASTWSLHGRALQGLDRLDEAEAAFRNALRDEPRDAPAHRDLAHLVWMRTEDTGAATAALDEAIARFPRETALRVVKAKLLEYAGDVAGAYAALESVTGQTPPDPVVELTASQIAVNLDAARALSHAERALSVAPPDSRAVILAVAAEASLVAGQPDAAARHAEAMLQIEPNNQQALGLLATAWRMLGDARYGELYDYEAFVKPARLDTPDGWPSLDAWLADLAIALDRMHGHRGHPIGQSLRDGTQTNQSLEKSPDPAVRAYFEAVRGPISRYIETLGRGRDPLRSRNTGRFALSGSWSVRLRPGGRHVPHLHPRGWISSASYIQLPDAVQNNREGWIAFGQFGLPTDPPLPAEHWVKPEPGMLVLFPSYMWHGTLPFSGDQTRLTCAFDVVPG